APVVFSCRRMTRPAYSCRPRASTVVEAAAGGIPPGMQDGYAAMPARVRVCWRPGHVACGIPPGYHCLQALSWPSRTGSSSEREERHMPLCDLFVCTAILD